MFASAGGSRMKRPSPHLIRAARGRLTPILERLDARFLPAAGVTAGIVAGVLTVQGTEADDVVGITFRGNPGHGPRLGGFVTVAGVGRFRAARIREVVVIAGAGDDTIAVRAGARWTMPVAIDPGAGDDVIRIRDGLDRVGDGPGTKTINGEPIAGAVPITIPTTSSNTTTTSTTTKPSSAMLSVELTGWESQLFDLTNQARVEFGVAPLRLSDKLVSAARIQTQQMASLGRMEHHLNGAALPDLEDRARYVGYRYGWLGENIAYNQGDPASVVAAWMNSPGHRSNILNPNFTEFGASVSFDGRGAPYWAQEFASEA